MIGTAVFNQSVGVLIRSVVEKKPVLTLRINGVPVDSEDCVYVLPAPRLGPYPIQFSVQNTGKLSANDAQVAMLTFDEVQKYVNLGSWTVRRTVPTAGVIIETNSVVLVEKCPLVLAPGSVFVCGKFEIQQGPKELLEILYLEIETSAPSVVKNRFRVHILCNPKYGKERMLTGRKAREAVDTFRTTTGRGQIVILTLPTEQTTNTNVEW